MAAVVLAPAVAVAIYGLFASRTVETMRLALTDPLTSPKFVGEYDLTFR